MFRKRPEPPQPAWRERFDRARRLVEAQRPPDFILAQLAGLERAIDGAHADRDRLRDAISQLDADRAAAELKQALRVTNPPPGHDRLVASLRERYESIHRLQNREDDLGAAIDRALVDVDLLAARSVDLGGTDDRWRLDETVRRLADDLTALDLAHRELADL
jgi:hypothetical protein